jgi:serine/threonine protein kinase
MRFLSDDAVKHLRGIAELPDFTGTRYRLGDELARGGMGVVYRAEDLELQRIVALKVLATDLSTAAAAERMRDEARIIARLEHPGIVPVHDVGTLADGRVYYAMKLVEGRHLDEVAVASEVPALLRIFIRICEAVAFAHANDVVHRDLKPENVMIGAFGEVVVMDWGIARAGGDRDGLVAGTLGYMAPEQERGEPVDARADLFAIGVMLRKLLGGRITKPLRAICDKAAAPGKEDRYENAVALANDLLLYLDAEPIAAYRENVYERFMRWLARNRALVAVIAAYLLMRLLLFLWVRR